MLYMVILCGTLILVIKLEFCGTYFSVLLLDFILLHLHWLLRNDAAGLDKLVSFPQSPNRTSLAAVYGPISNLLDALQNKKNFSRSRELSIEFGWQQDTFKQLYLFRIKCQHVYKDTWSMQISSCICTI